MKPGVPGSSRRHWGTPKQFGAYYRQAGEAFTLGHGRSCGRVSNLCQCNRESNETTGERTIGDESRSSGTICERWFEELLGCMIRLGFFAA